MAAPAPLRIAVLECDQPLDRTRVDLGGHTGVWRALLAAAAAALEPRSSPPPPLQLQRWDVVAVQAYPSLAAVDGILVSGSRYSAFGDDAWVVALLAFVRRALARGVRLVGICFGHQIIARALGARVVPSAHGWELGPTPLALTSRGQALFGRPGLTLHLMNRDVVAAVPDDVELLASTASSRVHGLYRPGKFLTVQGHPEFSSVITGEILNLRSAAGIIADEPFRDAMKRLATPHDGVVVAQAILKFFARTLDDDVSPSPTACRRGSL